MGNDSAPGALVRETASLFQPSPSTARQAASRLCALALTYWPAGFSTLPAARWYCSMYCTSSYPMEPGVLFTFSAISELRSAGVPTGQCGEGERPIFSRNFGLVLVRKSEKT